MRLLICAGGTGGGVYPALAVLQALTAKHDVLWVGGEGGMEAALVERAGVPFKTIPAAQIHGVGLAALPGNMLRIVRGVVAARRILRDFRPDVLFFTGGFVAFPMAVAGMSIPSLLYVPDIEPGMALKAIARFARTITLTAEASRAYFAANTRSVVTGYPTRADLGAWTREKAQAHFGLDPQLPTLLIFGGSKGARSINTAALNSLEQLLETAQVIHISGALDWETVGAKARGLSPALAQRYHPMPYLHEMGAALAAADLAVSRAGASALGEYPLFGLPAILVPYPYAWRYQKVNADHLTSHGAALMIKDEELPEKLAATALSLLQGAPRREAMKNAMRALATPNAASAIANELTRLAGGAQ